METNGPDGKPSASAYFRHRSSTFSKEEVIALLQIVDKYKTVVFNKSTSAAASHAKDVIWSKIAKIYNTRGFRHRSVDCLKTKWDNLKRDARKVSKNLMEVKYSEFDDTIGQMVAMMCEAENNTSNVEQPVDSEGEFNDTEENVEITNDAPLNGNELTDSEDSSDCEDNINKRLVNRSINFSPQECNLLMQCVKQEKNILFSKSNKSGAIKIKNRAWQRVTNSYNKLSPQKRSTKMLRTKFTNMKRMAKTINFKSYLKDFRNKQDSSEDTGKEIKSEPLFEYREDLDPDVNDDDNNSGIEDKSSSHNGHIDSALDPLSHVLCSDSGLSSVSLSENKEVVKLKLELLNYELETAKLQRKRIEELARIEAAEHETKALESSLRLRAARLEVIAAELKLPHTHPGLAYTPEEARAQHYVHQYHAT